MILMFLPIKQKVMIFASSRCVSFQMNFDQDQIELPVEIFDISRYNFADFIFTNILTSATHTRPHGDL